MTSKHWIPDPIAGSAFMVMMVIDYPFYLVFGAIGWFYANFTILFLGNTIIGGAWWYMIGRLLDSWLRRRAKTTAVRQ
jgi:hypothetical protein